MIVGLILTACGPFKGGYNPPNDPIPNGTQITSATLTAGGGKTVSGTVEIYRVDVGTYVIRLDNVILPTESNLEIIGTNNLGTLSPINLRFSTGTQNYNVQVSGTPHWTQVAIYSPSAQQNYAFANFSY